MGWGQKKQEKKDNRKGKERSGFKKLVGEEENTAVSSSPSENPQFKSTLSQSCLFRLLMPLLAQFCKTGYIKENLVSSDPKQWKIIAYFQLSRWEKSLVPPVKNQKTNEVELLGLQGDTFLPQAITTPPKCFPDTTTIYCAPGLFQPLPKYIPSHSYTLQSVIRLGLICKDESCIRMNSIPCPNNTSTQLTLQFGLQSVGRNYILQGNNKKKKEDFKKELNMNYKYSFLVEAATEKICSSFQQYILLYLEAFTNLNQLSR